MILTISAEKARSGQVPGEVVLQNLKHALRLALLWTSVLPAGMLPD